MRSRLIVPLLAAHLVLMSGCAALPFIVNAASGILDALGSSPQIIDAQACSKAGSRELVGECWLARQGGEGGRVDIGQVGQDVLDTVGKIAKAVDSTAREEPSCRRDALAAKRAASRLEASK